MNSESSKNRSPQDKSSRPDINPVTQNLHFQEINSEQSSKTIGSYKYFFKFKLIHSFTRR